MPTVGAQPNVSMLLPVLIAPNERSRVSTHASACFPLLSRLWENMASLWPKPRVLG